jgi:hypothetical protein
MFVEFDYLPHYLCRNIDEYFRFKVPHQSRGEHNFIYCFAKHGNASDWNTSALTRLYLGSFFDDETFNENINEWDVSNVQDMDGAFYEFETFNQPLDKWDVSNVYWMHSIFYHCVSFTHCRKSLNSWNVKNLEDVALSFYWGFEE